MEKTPRRATCATTLIGKLSKGYRQRVGLAQAILHNPDVLILDEPTAGLDPKQIIETRELIKGLGGEHTIVLSTHILPEVSMTCGRVVIINKGRVVAEDTPDNLTHRLQGAAALRLEVRGEAAGGSRRRCAPCPGVLAVRARARRRRDRRSRSRPRPAATCAPSSRAAVVARGFDLLGLQQVGHEPGGDLPAPHHHRRRRRAAPRRRRPPPRRR